MTVAADELRPLYRTLLILAGAAVVILGLGLAELVYFEPPGQQTGTAVRVEGIYKYDPQSGQIQGKPTTRFTIDDAFAAVVDWGSVPGSMVVAARWYNSLGTVVGDVGPAPAASLAGHRVVPAQVPKGFTRNLPGEYVFVIERYAHGQPVELLARRLVLVRQTA